MRSWSRKKGTRTGSITLCGLCGKQIYSLPSAISRNKGKFCSHSCRAKSYYPNHLKSFSGGTIARSAGRNALLRFARDVREDGSKHARWKGDSVKYGALHGWVVTHKGKPSKCEICGTTDSGERYEWANVNHQYRRNLDDFVRMCVTCHRIFDFKAAKERRKRGDSSRLAFVPKT